MAVNPTCLSLSHWSFFFFFTIFAIKLSRGHQPDLVITVLSVLTHTLPTLTYIQPQLFITQKASGSYHIIEGERQRGLGQHAYKPSSQIRE